MYVTLPGITNGQSIELLRTIDNSDGQLEVALCDVTYYPRWTNVSAAKDNNDMYIAGEHRVVKKKFFIPHGYYSVCSLNDEIFKPNGISITQNEWNGKVKIYTGETGILIGGNLAITLGFVWAIDLPRNKTVDKRNSLI